MNKWELIEFLDKWDVIAFYMTNGDITGLTPNGIKEFGAAMTRLIDVIDGEVLCK